MDDRLALFRHYAIVVQKNHNWSWGCMRMHCQVPSPCYSHLYDVCPHTHLQIWIVWGASCRVPPKVWLCGIHIFTQHAMRTETSLFQGLAFLWQFSYAQTYTFSIRQGHHTWQQSNNRNTAQSYQCKIRIQLWALCVLCSIYVCNSSVWRVTHTCMHMKR